MARIVDPAFCEAGDGQAMIFLHGIGGDQHSFDDQLPHFAQNYRAISWDMPGYGDSALPEQMTFPVLADCLARLMDNLNLPSAILMGHSMGGMVAQEFIHWYPQRVDTLILSGTSPAFGKPGGDWQKKFLEARLAPLDQGQTPADFASELVLGMLGDFKTPKTLATATRSMAALSPQTYRAALNCIVTFDQRAGLADIAVPTFCLAGENDRNAAPEVMERMAAKIPGAQYYCLPGVGHIANIERPDLFNGAIDTYLQSLCPQSL